MANSFNNPPEWAKKAIWYQIFVERFRNGNKTSNPTFQSIQGSTVDKVPDDWIITPWGHDWYAKDPWAIQMPVDFYRAVQLRRYGGDLSGVLLKIPYLKKLGVNAVYFNPLNHAPSLHKYDTTYYHHIDVHFGPDPVGDLKLIKKEDPGNPETWTWTEADKLFIQILKILDENEIHVIVDFSWNHTGHTFWAFEDIKKHKSNSEYIDWYEGIHFNESDTLKYGSWNDISTLPELKKTNKGKNPEKGFMEGDLHPGIKKHIFDVCTRWIQPVIQGKKHKGIDGMRLDVADLVPMSFWRELRQYTRSLNKNFLLVGENWWEEWPHKLLDPRPWLEGDSFDSVMHYQWFQVARAYFGDSADHIDLPEFIGKMQALYSGIRVENCRVLMNLASSHDAPRIWTSMFNKNQYKFKCKPPEDDSYRTDFPDELGYTNTMLLLIHQFTFLGTPHIWNGDEMGMTGADDPDNRKPLHWPDIHFNIEHASEYSNYDYQIQPVFDANIFDFFQKLIKLRKKHLCFSLGNCLFYTNDILTSKLVIYTRTYKNQSIVIMINNNPEPYKIPKIFQGGSVLFYYNISDCLDTKIPPYAALIKKYLPDIL
ncbi:MAG: hypothetical protein IPN79_02715 [Saprospiraceae bacterium]|nr:hypothetical protein [Saprospiraceae bacterium]